MGKIMDIYELVLNRKHYIVQRIISASELEVTLDIDKRLDLEGELMGLELRADFRPLGVSREDKVAEYPSSLWQHIKKTLKLPYKKHEVIMKQDLVFPEIDIDKNDSARVFTTYDYIRNQ